MKADIQYKEISCCVCKGTDFSIISDEIQFGREEKVSICNNCGLVQLNPRMTNTDYKNYYAFEYNQHYRPKIVDSDYQKIKIIIARLRKGKENFSYNNILEIGSGSGESLKYLRTRFFKKSKFYAIEPSIECKTELDKSSINIVANYLQDVDLDKYRAKFDLIILRHVAEHFTTPIKDFKLISELLSEDGICYIAVPNSLKPTIPIRNNHFRNVHTYYYNKYSIRNILGSSNLEISKLIDSDCHQISELIIFAKKKKEKQDFEITIDPSHVRIQKDLYKKKLESENNLGFKMLYYIKHRTNKYWSRLLLWIYSSTRYI